MKTSTIGFALLHLAGFSYAAPGSGYVDARQTSNNNVFYVFFSGAGSNPPGFELEFPSNGSTVAITNPLIVSQIQVGGIGTCEFAGLEGSGIFIGGGNSGDVVPPQPQISGFCFPY